MNDIKALEKAAIRAAKRIPSDSGGGGLTRNIGDGVDKIKDWSFAFISLFDYAYQIHTNQEKRLIPELEASNNIVEVKHIFERAFTSEPSLIMLLKLLFELYRYWSKNALDLEAVIRDIPFQIGMNELIDALSKATVIFELGNDLIPMTTVKKCCGLFK